VLLRDRRRQLDELRFVEDVSEAIHEVARNLGRRLRHRDGEIEHEAFRFVERRTRFVAREIQELLLRDTEFSADRRADVESKRTADERARLDLAERLEPGRNAAARFERHFEHIWKATARVTFWGAFAMGITALGGQLKSHTWGHFKTAHHPVGSSKSHT
jgi:hypothetical protein